MKKGVRIVVTALVLLVIAFALIQVILFSAQENYWREQAAQVHTHREVWQKQGVTKYRLGINWQTTGGNCSREYVVKNEAITQIIKDCGYYPNLNTVEDLFLMIEDLIGARECGGNGCGCDGPYHFDVVYDKQYGFPKIGRPVIHPQQSWRYGTQFFCTLAGTLGPEWQIYSFSPLP